MKAFIEGQGGDPTVIDDYELFGKAEYKVEIVAETDGFIGRLRAKQVGLASQHAGAGRASKEDIIDMTAGIYLDKKVGESVKKGDRLATVFGNDQNRVKTAAAELKGAFEMTVDRPEERPLIHKIIGD